MLNELVVNELQELQQEHQGFKIDSLESVNWGFRKLRALDEQLKEYEKLAMAEIERIQIWFNQEADKIKNQKAFFEGYITEYATEQRRLNSKFKISTPYGKVSFRKQQPRWDYNEEEVINWAKQNDRTDLVRVKEELDKKQLKWYAKQVDNYAVTEDGEVIPGIEIIEQDEAIKIEVAE
jgi:phage host-nuclease inhibitor protein Gam